MEYIYEEIDIHILERKIRLLQITNVDEVFDHLIAQNPDHIDVVDERIPYWTELWPSAIALSQFILENPNLITSKSVLEIGCGLALPSIVSGFIFPEKITASDYLPDALQFVNKNWLFNHQSTVNFQSKCIDWRQLYSEYSQVPTFDTILASDIIYEKRYVEDMIKFVRKMPDNCVLLLSEPGRTVAKEFVELLKLEENIHYETTQIPVNHRGSLFLINIIKVSKSQFI